MSRLSSKRSRAGPITSTQIDDPTVSNGDGNGELLSREERIFQRQLESAIEMSRKTAIESASSGSDLSQEQVVKEPIKVVLKRKSLEENYSVTPPRKAKARKLVISDEDSDDEFVGFQPDKKKTLTKKVEEKKQVKSKLNTQNNQPKSDDLVKSEESKYLELKSNSPKFDVNNLENEKPVKNDEAKSSKIVSSTKSEVIDQNVKKSNEKESVKDKGDSGDKKSKLPNKRRKLVVSDDSDLEESSDEEEEVEKKMPLKSKKPTTQSKKQTVTTTTPKQTATITTPKQEVKKLEKVQQPSTPSPLLGASKPKLIAMPKWTPPARIGEKSKDSKTPSPGLTNLSPGFRVGLSRNVRIKPLHPNVKMAP